MVKHLWISSILVAGVVGCGSEAAKQLGDPCVASSECAAGLVCDLGVTPHVCAVAGTIDAAVIDADNTDAGADAGADGAAIDGAAIDGAVIDAAVIDAAVIDGAVIDAPDDAPTDAAPDA